MSDTVKFWVLMYGIIGMFALWASAIVAVGFYTAKYGGDLVAFITTAIAMLATMPFLICAVQKYIKTIVRWAQ